MQNIDEATKPKSETYILGDGSTTVWVVNKRVMGVHFQKRKSNYNINITIVRCVSAPSNKSAEDIFFALYLNVATSDSHDERGSLKYVLGSLFTDEKELSIKLFGLTEVTPAMIHEMGYTIEINGLSCPV